MELLGILLLGDRGRSPNFEESGILSAKKFLSILILF